MGNVIIRLPHNPDFDYEEWAAYRQRVYEPTHSFVWGPELENMDHKRLPGNINIFDLLIYIGKKFDEYQQEIGYAGENILYSPGFPDIIYSSQGTGTITGDSPHVKISPHIVFELRRRAPRSIDAPFGSRKNWKFKNCGEFEDTEGNVWILRSRWWENLVDFTVISRSGKEAEILTLMFEHFMDLNEWKFLEAGMAKMVPFGRLKEPVTRLEEAGVHYRLTMFWILTQEFQYAGPVTRITDIHMDVNPTLDV